MSVLLDVSALRVEYAGGIPALRGVDLHVDTGEVVAVLGANGAGKTTLLRSVTGLLRWRGGTITGGTISFDGRPTRADPRQLVRAGLAQVLEGRRLFPELTVEENLTLGGSVLRSAKAVQARAEWAFGRFPILAEFRRTQAGLLSGGQQQIVAIARALMPTPRLLVLDEPSLGLSPLAVAEIRDLIAELHQAGTAVLLVEQNARMALSLADRGYLVERGRIRSGGTPTELAEAGILEALTVGTEPIRPASTVASAPQELPWLR